MKTDPPFLDVERTKTLAELVGKASLGLLASCYAMGLVVINIHLNNYGVFSLSLLRVSYIIAGLWATVPILFGLGLIYSVIGLVLALDADNADSVLVYMFSLPRALTESQDALGTKFQGWSMAGSLFLVGGFLGFIFWQLGIGFQWKWLLTLLTGSLVALFILPIHYNFALPRTKTVAELVNRAFGAVTTGFLLVIHIVVFANHVYPSLPSHIGGGQPKTVQLIVENEPNTKKLIEDLGVALQGQSGRTEDIQLLFVTDEVFIILISENDGEKKAVSLSKGLVKATSY